MRSVVNLFGTYAKLTQRVNSEVVASLSEMDDPDPWWIRWWSTSALKLEDKQRLLEILCSREEARRTLPASPDGD